MKTVKNTKKATSSVKESMAINKAKRKHPRSGDTVQRILETTERVLLDQGVSDMKVRTICIAANISRATFYRYFGSKEDLLEALIQYEREQFDRVVSDNTGDCVTPHDRIVAYFASIETYLNGMSARRLFEVEPKFTIEHFRRFFPQSITRTMEVLAPAFDEWDRQLGNNLDRKFISELLVRFMLSIVWVPVRNEPDKFLDRLELCLSMCAKLVKDDRMN